MLTFKAEMKIQSRLRNSKKSAAGVLTLYKTTKLTLYILGYFYTLFVPGGGKFAPLSKNRLVTDRIEIFWLLKLFFVKFLKINF